jgi:hypothetical protein
VCVRYKFVAQNVKTAPLSNGSIPDAGLNWRGRAIARAIPILGPWIKWFIPKFPHGARGGRLTPERLQELRIGSILWLKEKEAILSKVSNREYYFSWTWKELGKFSDEVEPPQRIRLESAHMV